MREIHSETQKPKDLPHEESQAPALSFVISPSLHLSITLTSQTRASQPRFPYSESNPQTLVTLNRLH